MYGYSACVLTSFPPIIARQSLSASMDLVDMFVVNLVYIDLVLFSSALHTDRLICICIICDSNLFLERYG